MAALGLGRLEYPLKRTITLRSIDCQSRLSFRVRRRAPIVSNAHPRAVAAVTAVTVQPVGARETDQSLQAREGLVGPAARQRTLIGLASFIP